MQSGLLMPPTASAKNESCAYKSLVEASRLQWPSRREDDFAIPILPTRSRPERVMGHLGLVRNEGRRSSWLLPLGLISNKRLRQRVICSKAETPNY